jgi:hypothetical protein
MKQDFEESTAGNSEESFDTDEIMRRILYSNISKDDKKDMIEVLMKHDGDVNDYTFTPLIISAIRLKDKDSNKPAYEMITELLPYNLKALPYNFTREGPFYSRRNRF